MPLPSAHSREHSLEMQLPFLRRAAAGSADRAVAHRLPDRRHDRAACRRARAVWRRRSRLLLVASSDLSHYFDAATAEALDQRVQDCVADFDADRLLELFEQYPEGERGRYVACGGGAIIAVMMAAQGARGTGAHAC